MIYSELSRSYMMIAFHKAAKTQITFKNIIFQHTNLKMSHEE